MPTVATLVTCDDITAHSPYALVGARREWPSPPRRMAIYVEVINKTEQPYEFALELWRGKKLVYVGETELILGGRRRTEHVLRIDPLNVEPKTYRLVVLIDGETGNFATLTSERASNEFQ